MYALRDEPIPVVHRCSAVHRGAPIAVHGPTAASFIGKTPIRWVGADLLPDWARRLHRYPETPALAQRAMRGAVKSAIVVAHDTVGGSAEYRQASARVAVGYRNSAATSSSA